MASLAIILIALMALILPAISSTASLSSTIASVPASSSASIVVSTVTISPVPAPSDALSKNDTSDAARLQYQPIFNIDYHGQDISWIWARSYEDCLHFCDSYNAGNFGNGTIFCKAALFAPDRINGLNDCYLKKSLDMPQPANITLIGGIKLDCNHSASSFASSVWSSVAPNSTGTSAASANASSTFQTSMITTKSTSSSSMTTPKLPHVSTASNLSPSSSPPTQVLTLPTATHTHEVM